MVTDTLKLYVQSKANEGESILLSKFITDNETEIIHQTRHLQDQDLIWKNVKQCCLKIFRDTVDDIREANIDVRMT